MLGARNTKPLASVVWEGSAKNNKPTQQRVHYIRANPSFTIRLTKIIKDIFFAPPDGISSLSPTSIKEIACSICANR